MRLRSWRDYQRYGRRRRIVRRLSAVTGLGLALLALAGLAATMRDDRPGAGGAFLGQPRTAAPAVEAAPDPASEFRLDPSDLAAIEVVDGAAVVALPDGHRARLTLDPDLQERLEKILARARPIAGAIVMLDPRDGRVLGLASTARDRALGVIALRSEFPAASLFKLVTAAAGLEAGTVTPATKIYTVGGGLRRLRPEHVRDNPDRERWVMTMEQALARSNNPVLAKVAVKRVGADRLAAAAEAFAFNRQIPFELPLGVSRASVPDDPFGLGKTGAGFGEVTISPLHAALISAAIANEGHMPRPWIVESVVDAKGRVVYEARPEVLVRTMRAQTASALAGMMVDTVTQGTSRRAFRDSRAARRGEIAGKTGSLNGNNPRGHYDWFTGFAPVDDPEVAVAALLVNGDLWYLKGSGAAREALEAFWQTRR
ncbi:MAG TPA: penicillin-binding transpeptidase domain-containing protein [Thermodesulfobacteriota bacterium]